jgi:chromate transporter
MLGIGLNSFGGPVAQIGFMHREAVEKRAWVTDAQFLNLVAFANVLPGPEALEVAIHLGFLRRGRLGGIVAGLLFVLPGFAALTLLAWIYVEFGKIAAIEAFLDGIRPVAAAFLAFAALRFGTRSVTSARAALLTAAAYAASFLLAVPFLILLPACGLAGLLVAPREQTPLGRRGRAAVVALVALGVGSGLLSAFGRPQASTIAAARPPETSARAPSATAERRLIEVGWVNLKAAMVTFGGAYTVLPYLREQMVVRKGWISDREMVDALALGETTPGPLISIGVFLAYLAGGPAGAIVGGFFLFLPSFVLVLGLAPRLEAIVASPAARRILWGFAAGTMGLILSLAAALLPHGVPDVFSLAVAGLAFAALWRLDANALLVVLAGGLAGLARAL